jgi:hypothetical protein
MYIVAAVFREDVQSVPVQIRDALHFMPRRSIAFLIFECPDADLTTGVPTRAIQFEYGHRGGLSFYDSAREVEELIRTTWRLGPDAPVPAPKTVKVATRRVGQKVKA